MNRSSSLIVAVALALALWPALDSSSAVAAAESTAPAAPFGSPPQLPGPTKLLRFPDIYGDRVAFCYGGDLWTASANGGLATRLTADDGVEVFPKFSPDGQWIAFTGQYDGDEQVYVIPSTGGVPKQMTYYPARGPLTPRWGYDNQVYGWTPDGKQILFRSMRDGFELTDTRLYTVPLEGGLATALPMPVSGAGDLSPDATHICYSPLVRDFRTWKRYEGGWAQDLWIFDLRTHDAQNITNTKRTDRDPMWIGDAIWYASDRDGTLNLYKYDVTTKQTAQVTHSTVWDVRWPSSDNRGQIVYELNGELSVLDCATGQARALSITVPSDGQNTRPSRVAAARQIEGWTLSPKGERALFVARGDVFTVPIEKGNARNLTRSSDAHDKHARWSPDGRTIAFISDRGGEEEVWLVDQDGNSAPRQLTDGHAAMLYAPEWSPDGARIAFADKEGQLHVATIADKKERVVADERQGQIDSWKWSPDGNWIAVTLSDPNEFGSIWIWGVADGQLRRVTDELWNEHDPAWDPEGNYLYFLADRGYPPLLSDWEFNYAIESDIEIFAMSLRKDVKHPFPPQSDEVTLDGDTGSASDGAKSAKDAKDAKDAQDAKDGKSKGDKDSKKKTITPIKIDFDGLAQRVTRVPVDAANLTALMAKEEHLLFLSGGPQYYGRDAAQKTALKVFSIKDREATTLADDVDAYALSADGSKLLAHQGTDYNLYDATPKGKDSKKKVSTAELMVDRVPAQEWAECFDEVWRRYRDFFYVPNMHGYDWKALGDRYRALVPYVAHRSDLNYVIGEMIAELNVGHCYVQGGDWDSPPRPRVALPGARFELDASAGRYRIARIFDGQNQEDEYRSPLTEVGVDAKVGDYVLAIDGEELRANDDPYRLLRNKADRAVGLTVNSRPSLEGARKITFQPIASEESLVYLAWVQRNRAMVDKLSNGRVGYLHLPDMGGPGIREFIKWYYGQIRKEGLVIDVRGNGGGNVSQMIIERLRRTLLRTRFVRTNDDPLTYPSKTFYGHFVCLLSETSASDGDIFPAMFRKAGLGPLIGKRTWGGVTGISGHGPLIDGGQISVPQFGTNDIDGSWIIEGHGVDPDIEVENDVPSVLAGHDPQLERGVAEVMKAMATDPKRLPNRPTDPVKTK